MANFVARKLEEWNLSELKDVFEENLIDEESFHLLDVATVKELIKPIGLRVKFLNRFKELQDQGTVAVPVDSCSESSVDTECSPSPSEPVLAVTPSTSDLSSPSCSKMCNRTASPEPALMPPLKKFKNDFSVKRLLQEHSSTGAEIVQEIEDGPLSRKSRLQMVRILVAYLIDKFGDRPRGEIKVALAKAVITEFPSLKDDEGEGYEAWYTPGIGLHSSTGWLEERLRNVRRRSNEKSSIKQVGQKKTKLLNTTIIPEPELTEEEFSGMKEWLCDNVEPISKVTEFMEKTAVKRALYLRGNAEYTLDKIIMEFPRLFDTPGMVELDFRTIYPDVAERLYLQWTPGFAEKVLRYADLQGHWATYMNIDPRKLDTDAKKINVSLQLLPTILPCGQKGKKRSTIIDAMKSYIDVQPVVTNMPKYLEEITNRQPYVLILGEVADPSQMFVIVERKALPQTSLLKAVDVCFKLFYVLNLDYPWESGTTWEFHQKVVYGLGEGKGKTKTCPAVIAMRTSLAKL